MIRVASTGEVLVLIQFKTELQARRSLIADPDAAFPQITTLQYVINEKQNDTIYDQGLSLTAG